MNAILIGCGAMGLRHAQALNNAGFTITTAMDLSAEAVEVGVQQGLYPASAGCTEPQAAFRDTDAELAVIATTAPFHAEYLRHAANAGIRRVLCEKPLAPSIAQCAEMLRVCRDNSIRCAVNHQRRFFPVYERVRELRDSDALGEITAIQINAGNFGIAMNGSHYIEIASYLLQERFTGVTGWLNDAELPNPRGERYKDFAGCIRATTAGGRRFYLDAGSDQAHGLNVSISGRNGQLQIDDLAGRLHGNLRKAEHRDAVSTRYAMPWEPIDEEFTVDIVQVTEQVIAALMDDGDYPTLEDGLHTIQVLAGAHLSNETDNRPVALAELEAVAERVFPWA